MCYLGLTVLTQGHCGDRFIRPGDNSYGLGFMSSQIDLRCVQALGARLVPIFLAIGLYALSISNPDLGGETLAIASSRFTNLSYRFAQ